MADGVPGRVPGALRFKSDSRTHRTPTVSAKQNASVQNLARSAFGVRGVLAPLLATNRFDGFSSIPRLGQ
jgi:hypothetical protein